ncbi:hypothetical protein BDP81DRAFT_397804 [Colletotrichum phormii]|uniref:Uncharacterized protein n=1 Tax=Colletotrichum phormii TaxID=359342 RepID=A0AAI9ZJS4_9PEZI|nr:uncharacterized protein BDP81DRAFT_397804 [Colletotrichum phormii]KAK1625528.1 hypothetical protein BDP81DRAFT_397804 [Colletotrichum phormii]
MAEERMREKAVYSDFLETAYREKYGDQWDLHLKSEHPTFEIKRKPVPSSQSSSRGSSPSASSSRYSGTPMNEYSSGSWFNTPSPGSSRSSSRSPSRSEASSRSDSSKTLVNGGKHLYLVTGRNHSHAAVWPVSYNPPPYIAHRPLSIISEDGTGETAARAARQALLQTAQRQVTPVATGHKKKLKMAYERVRELRSGSTRRAVSHAGIRTENSATESPASDIGARSSIADGNSAPADEEINIASFAVNLPAETDDSDTSAAADRPRKRRKISAAASTSEPAGPAAPALNRPGAVRPNPCLPCVNHLAKARLPEAVEPCRDCLRGAAVRCFACADPTRKARCDPIDDNVRAAWADYNALIAAAQAEPDLNMANSHNHSAVRALGRLRAEAASQTRAENLKAKAKRDAKKGGPGASNNETVTQGLVPAIITRQDALALQQQHAALAAIWDQIAAREPSA